LRFKIQHQSKPENRFGMCFRASARQAIPSTLRESKVTILIWIILGAIVIVLWTLNSQNVAAVNSLTCYVGTLLLDDSLRATHKGTFERFLLESKETNASDLSTHALLAIQRESKRIAGSLLLAFHGIVWNRKQALEKEAK
jgi:hypothetical protein